MTTLKTYGAILVMFGCFVIIYPRFIHPIFLGVFGLKEQSKTNDALYPPGHKGGHPSEKPHRGDADDIRKHMRHGPHPGMRAAAEMQRQQSQGSGRGMMGVVLPMYAVGIVLYLAYTLYKVFNKSNAKNNDSPYRGRNSFNRNNRFRDRDRMGFPKDFDSNRDVHNFLYDQQHRENLEDLLTRVDDKNISVEEMRILQQRLEETEAQMSRILNAMQAVNANVDSLKKAEEQAAPGDKKDEEGEEPSSEEQKKEGEDVSPAPKEGEDEGQPMDEDKTKEDVTEAENDEKKNEVDDSEEVDEIIEGKKDDDDDTNALNVRQRNVKLNEQ